MPSLTKMRKNLLCLTSTLKKNTLISLMELVEDVKVLYGSGDEVMNQKLSFLLLCQCSIAECGLVLIRNPKSVQSEIETRQD